MTADLRRYIDLLTEITRPQTRADADRILRTAGYRRLDPGSFGAVYQKPGKSYVLKVFSAADQAYLDFVALARIHAHGNPHFPKFFGKVVAITPQLSAIRIEPLTPYKGNSKYIYNYFRLRDYQGDPNSYSMMEKADAFEILGEYPKLLEACDLVIDHLLPHYESDIKQNNIMQRGSTIVLADPVKDIHADPLDKLPYVDQPEPEVAPKATDIDPDDLLRQLGISS